jgi:hypothetical protein
MGTTGAAAGGLASSGNSSSSAANDEVGLQQYISGDRWESVLKPIEFSAKERIQEATIWLVSKVTDRA